MQKREDRPPNNIDPKSASGRTRSASRRTTRAGSVTVSIAPVQFSRFRPHSTQQSTRCRARLSQTDRCAVSTEPRMAKSLEGMGRIGAIPVRYLPRDFYLPAVSLGTPRGCRLCDLTALESIPSTAVPSASQSHASRSNKPVWT